MDKIDIPCSCGHLLRAHYDTTNADTSLQRWGCETCFTEHETQTVWQHWYKKDNLRYLENLV